MNSQAVGPIDNRCQNQCYLRDSNDFCDQLCSQSSGLIPTCAASGAIVEGDHAFGISNASGARPVCSSPPMGSVFDAEHCKAECLRNACDLQYRTQAHWNSDRQMRCQELDFTRWSTEENEDSVGLNRICLCAKASAMRFTVKIRLAAQ